MALAFLDTNILLRHLLHDEPTQSPKATRYLARIERGEIEVCTADTVVFETVFTLERTCKRPKVQVRDALLPLLELPGILLPGKRRFRKVFDLYIECNIPFADAYHAIVMEHLHVRDVATFDTDFDRVPSIQRVELRVPHASGCPG